MARSDLPAKVQMYGTDWCPYCVRARNLLDDKGVEYEDFRLTTAPQLRLEMERRSGGARTVPQIFIDDLHVGGSDELYALEYAGQLDELLGVTEPDS